MSSKSTTYKHVIKKKKQHTKSDAEITRRNHSRLHVIKMIHDKNNAVITRKGQSGSHVVKKINIQTQNS